MAVQDRLTLRNAYLYLVCLITLVVSLFAAVSLVRSAVGIFYPDPGYYGYYEAPPGEEISDEQIARQQELGERSQQRQEVLSLVGSATTLLIAGPLYLYHWRRVQAELPTRSDPALAGAPPAP